jgi:hypothetical protein
VAVIPIGLIRALFSPIIERLEALEARPVGVIDGGVWTEGKNYAPFVGVTHDGGFWVSQEQTSEQPGGSPAWRLAVHRGKQGREGKPGSPCRCAERVGSEARR